MFDKDLTGFIGVGQLRYILTNLGEKMTDDEVDELLKAVDTSSGEINYTGMLPDPEGIQGRKSTNMRQIWSALSSPTNVYDTLSYPLIPSYVL